MPTRSEEAPSLDAELRVFAEGEAAGTKVGERGRRLVKAVARTAQEP